MALANHRVRAFGDIQELSKFIQEDPAILTIVSLGTDDNGRFILVFTV
jgi:hypothetical protein